jgi:phosphoribosylanthranilate isomerase
MVRIKICGITRPQDALAASDAGADAIGLVFAKSPRQVSIRQARAIAAALPPFVSAVGVFANMRPATIIRAAAIVGFAEVQLHGEEAPDTLRRLAGLRVLKALRVRDRTFVDQLLTFAQAGAAGIVLDAFSPESRGGTGKRFDWDLLAGLDATLSRSELPPLILAGGLTPDNVKAGIRRVRPWGVDVSSGVESEPGVKSPEKLARFVAAVREAERAPRRVPHGLPRFSADSKR